MKKVRVKSKDVNKELNLNLSKKDAVEVWDNQFIIINNVPSFFKYENNYVPTIKYLQHHQILKKITVDMGAIKFVSNGADIMRPGIVKIDPEIKQNEPIAIIDEKNNVTLAVGIALYNSEEMKQMDNGKVIKNIHYINDEIWNIK
jgi:PUA-domain protein